MCVATAMTHVKKQLLSGWPSSCCGWVGLSPGVWWMAAPSDRPHHRSQHTATGGTRAGLLHCSVLCVGLFQEVSTPQCCFAPQPWMWSCHLISISTILGSLLKLCEGLLQSHWHQMIQWVQLLTQYLLTDQWPVDAAGLRVATVEVSARFLCFYVIDWWSVLDCFLSGTKW